MFSADSLLITVSARKQPPADNFCAVCIELEFRHQTVAAMYPWAGNEISKKSLKNFNSKT